MKQWRDDLKKSKNRFINLVWPDIKVWFNPESQLIQVEEIQDSYAELLDKEAGIDYLVKDEIGIRPLSARVQTEFKYKTLTIREKRASGAKTELEKLINRVNSNYLHPWLHIQAYVDISLNKLVQAYGVETIDLVNLIKSENKNIWYRQKNNKDGNIFLVFLVSGLENLGINLFKFIKNS